MNIIIQSAITIPAVIINIPDNAPWSFTDDPNNKTVTINFTNTSLSFIVWSSDSYDEAGNYSQDDLNNAVQAWLTSNQQ